MIPGLLCLVSWRGDRRRTDVVVFCRCVSFADAAVGLGAGTRHLGCAPVGYLSPTSCLAVFGVQCRISCLPLVFARERVVCSSDTWPGGGGVGDGVRLNSRLSCQVRSPDDVLARGHLISHTAIRHFSPVDVFAVGRPKVAMMVTPYGGGAASISESNHTKSRRLDRIQG